MRQKGFTLIEGITIIAIVAILGAILYPTLRGRPVMFTRLPVAPLAFKDAELQTVVARLDAELRKSDRKTLSRVRWESEELRHRRVTLQTSQELPLRSVFALLEPKAKIRFDIGGLCGNCGGPEGRIVIRDVRPQSSRLVK